ncbi:pantoate--beta-alanine ligase [Pseudochryseolinea flava]|uniref:Pantothenate synthetase n=1 Tax=Pseudochryseolinea flava TaxID=2059302 RepID=A0A364YAN1_9BACT|nr:pantoate--beta-alanine ligase [Pseudochryseolinea flava]RAW03369.1 pantoate--beta-alanine ligase [Pseudochryseolinea flava]
MEIFNEIAPLKAFLKAKKQALNSIGLVPTMGALHSGHISLIEASKAENDLTVCSIFVNPAQFNNPNDLQRYPRTLDKDTLLLKKVECDAIFCPDSTEMYRHQPLIKFDFGHLDKIMEGKFRPGHFSGVALVVSKLFNIVEPHHAYFGQKDWQQYSIIRQLVDDLNFNLILHSVPTSREPDGLAMSSRNLRLNESQRQKAIVFFEALTFAKRALNDGAPLVQVQQKVMQLVEKDAEIKLEYFELADSKNLNLLENVKGASQPIMCIAGFVGEIRLIDNMFL